MVLYAGTSPKYIHTFEINNKEFMWWQYVPIFSLGDAGIVMPCPNLNWIRPIVGESIAAMDGFNKGYNHIYATVKSTFVDPIEGSFGNRPGWHIDGFGSEDTNFIWTDLNPTEYFMIDDGDSIIKLSEDHNKSMEQMETLVEALPQFIRSDCQKPYDLMMLDNKCIHRVNPFGKAGFRNFVKISFSDELYLAEGNSINHNLDYDWETIPRKETRNCPQGGK